MLKSLKSKLYLLVLIVSLPGVLIITLNALAQRSEIIASHKNQALAATQRLSLTQKQLIEKTHEYLKYLATAPELQSPSSPACGEFLAKILKLNTTYINLGVPRADGELLCNALPILQPVNVYDRAYFQRSLNKKTFAMGTYQQDRATHKTTVNFSYPVISSQDSVIAVVVAVLSLDWWSQQLSESPLPEDSIAFISDEEGAIVANFPVDLSIHGHGTDSYGVYIDISKHYELETDIIRGHDGISRIYTHQNIHKTNDGRNITVSVGIPISKALSHENIALLNWLLLFAAFLILVTYIAFNGLKFSVLDPLELLCDATEKLKNGQLALIPKDIGSQELSLLAQNFEQMARARLHAEEVVNQRNRELDSVFDALPDLYFKISSDDTIIEYRASTLGNLYVPPERFLGRKMTDVLPNDSAALYLQKTAELRNKKRLISWEYPLEINGKQQFFEARANAINHSNKIILVIRNITKRKSTEKSLQLAASVFENSSECMVVTDAHGYIINVNPSFTKITGYDKEEVLGHKTSIFSSGLHDVDFYATLWSALKQKGRWEGEVYNKNKNREILSEWLSINAIYNSNNEIIQYVALYRDISEQKNASQLIWHQANFDHLTDLPNRNSLVDHLDHEIIKAQRSKTQVAALFLDLDEFKQVNDTLGHDKGDTLLKLVSKRLLSKVRTEDLVARQGGDEFIIVLGNLSATIAAIHVAEQLLKVFDEPFDIEGETVYIAASIGISYFPQDGNSSAELLKTSDQAMYAAKASGKNCFHCFTQEMQNAALKRNQLIKELHIALEFNQFQLYFQPIISLSTGEILKAEALIRWNHPTKGLISPIEFIAVAEETKFIIEMGEWVFDNACTSLQKFKTIFGDSFQLSINVSPVQLSNSPKSLQQWADKLHGYGIDNSSLVIEITEGVLMSTTEESLALLLNFRDAGIGLALDDFGTGYSSLTYIREYDIDYLKIDREFIKNLPDSVDSKVICESVIVMAHKLGIKVIAEGIETLAQKNALEEMGCDFGQGYLFSKPLAYEHFITLAKML